MSQGNAVSPWSQVPRHAQQQMAAPAIGGQQGGMAPAQRQAPQQMSPDMTYPSYPNAAGLGSQVPFEEPVDVVPVPADQTNQTQFFSEMQPPEMGVTDPAMSPWALDRGGQ